MKKNKDFAAMDMTELEELYANSPLSSWVRVKALARASMLHKTNQSREDMFLDNKNRKKKR